MGTTAWGGLRERRMLVLHVLVLVLAPLASSQPAPTSCCETKTVGGVSYTFVREDSAAIGYSCLSPCVYERDDQPGTAFCFAQGDQQVGLTFYFYFVSRYRVRFSYRWFVATLLDLRVSILPSHA